MSADGDIVLACMRGQAYISDGEAALARLEAAENHAGYWKQRYKTQHRTVHRLEEQRDALAKTCDELLKALDGAGMHALVRKHRAALAEAGLDG